MKITKVTPIFAGRYLFVEVETDAGITGTGEAGAWGQLEAAAAAMAKFGDYLIGKDPGPTEDHWQVMQRFGHFRGAAICAAISALDIALWDIKGQALGQPIHALLGGPTRTKARVYCHVKAKTADEMVDRCIEMKERGFTAIGHLNPYLDEDRSQTYFATHAAKLGRAVDIVRRIREAVGDDVDLCLEMHRRLTPAEAIAFAREIAPFRPMFYEDPIPPTSHDAMARVDSRITLPLATGERFSTIYDFQTLFSRGAVSFARPSITLCGGFTGARKIAAMAEAHEIQLVPHNPLSPVSLAAGLQLAASIFNFAIQEYPTAGFADDTETGLELRGTELVTELPHLEKGFLTIPTSPGLGLKLVRNPGKVTPPLVRQVAMRRHHDGSPVDQ
ncbi:MAG: mandelate racemase/muconate lactonizing enzyme family protein [Beijerinckiaceae bacterium]